jgi:hypothetical protein
MCSHKQVHGSAHLDVNGRVRILGLELDALACLLVCVRHSVLVQIDENEVLVCVFGVEPLGEGSTEKEEESENGQIGNALSNL